MLLAWLAACGATGPGGTSSSEDAARSGGSIVVALRGDVDSWNPYTSEQASAANVLDLLYPRLVVETGDPDGEAFEPWLARRWSFSPDGRELTFELREDARWSDGAPVTCEDVRFTHAVQTAEPLAWPGAFLKDHILGVDCPAPHRAVFRFDAVYPDQILDANDDAVVPAAYGAVLLEEWRSTAWQDRMVTCGPFRLTGLTPGQEAVLERDPDWWGSPLPRLDHVVLRFFPDATAAMTELLAGEIDLMDKVPPLRASEIEGRADLALIERPSFSYAFLGRNVIEPSAYAADRRRRGCGGDDACPESAEDILRLRRESPHPVLADARVRRALTLGIDRRDLVDGLWLGRARVGTSPIVSALWAHDPRASLPFDPGRAARLLEEAGWRDGDGDGLREKDGRPLRLTVIVNADNQVRRDALERVARGLLPLGALLVPEPLPRAEYVARAREKRFDALLGGWRAGTRVEPQTILHSRAATAGGNNLGSWSTPESDRLMDEASRAHGRAEAKPLWEAWQRLFRDEQPYTVLYEETVLIGVSGRLRGATPSSLTPYRGLERWWVDGGRNGGSP